MGKSFARIIKYASICKPEGFSPRYFFARGTIHGSVWYSARYYDTMMICCKS